MPLSRSRNSAHHSYDLQQQLISRYRQVRNDSLDICRPLSAEDHCIQTTAEVSPPKWHLAHTSWFFEAFILRRQNDAYQPYHPKYDYLFNSYYETMGKPFPRAQRGLLSRPGVEEILQYRGHVDNAMIEHIENATSEQFEKLAFLVELGLNHEQQHQELLYTDIKQILAFNPLHPAYDSTLATPKSSEAQAIQWLKKSAGIHHIGNHQNGFSYDNEGPRHRVLLRDHQIANRTVNNAEYLAFMNAGGYEDCALWLADGWKLINDRQWNSPLYWHFIDGKWWYMTLSGLREIDIWAPVTHVSFYEADAYARWHGSRLPDEAEWELASLDHDPQHGNYRDSGYLQPIASSDDEGFFGNVWEWTKSPYQAYPGFKPLHGSVGEYNGKFMCNQMVLRGGSCVSPREHLRHTYRNFFYPLERWQFTGIRLAKD
ncbi:MAG: ergothioneine biosynthesis protein EgtB [Gammaproteobacteria bacterium]|nr:ergothioneine biosynthesis protein EgtB [Gammaproteobacteria bacterium]